LAKYTQGIVPDGCLGAMCRDAYNFDIPLEKIYDRVHLMRLDQGPTASFKDFAAQMMARLLGRFLKEDGKELIILTATSGDTGSAVAHAFHNIPGVRVIVLFPFAEVSVSQRKLMTALTGNVRTVAIDGKFDDCQAMVKRAFADPELQHLPLSSANSINIGRLLPQSVYYFYAASRLAEPGEPMVFSIPSGNFGDMMGSVVAREMGLPVRKIIASVNDNDAFPKFLATGIYEKVEPSRNCRFQRDERRAPEQPRPARGDLRRAAWMKPGKFTSNPIWRRCGAICIRVRSATNGRARPFWISGTNIQSLLEPHGAVAWQGFQDWLQTDSLNGSPAAILETANPAKFPEEIEKAFGWSPDVPPNMAAMIQLPEHYDQMSVDYEKFRDYLKHLPI
jgi:threonine synthase